MPYKIVSSRPRRWLRLHIDTVRGVTTCPHRDGGFFSANGTGDVAVAVIVEEDRRFRNLVAYRSRRDATNPY